MPLRTVFPYTQISKFSLLNGLFYGSFYPCGRYMEISGTVQIANGNVSIFDENGNLGQILGNIFPFMEYDGLEVKFRGYVDWNNNITPNFPRDETMFDENWLF